MYVSIVVSFVVCPCIHQFICCYHTPDRIEAETSKAEDNGPFTIYDLGQACEGVGNEVSRMSFGYTICLKIDIRYIVESPQVKMYKARISATNKVIVTVPAWDYNHLRHRDLFDAKVSAEQILIEDGMDNATDQYNKNKGERAHFPKLRDCLSG